MANYYLLLAILLSCTLFTPALADDSITPNSRPGIYFGAGGFHALEDFEGGGGFLDDAPGFNLRLGYRIHPRIAVEAMVDRINSFDASFRGFVGPGGFGRPTTRTEVDTWTVTLNGKFFLFTGRYQPYSLLGIGGLHAETTNKFSFPGGPSSSIKSNRIGLAFRYGAGIDTYFTENWVGNLEASYVHSITDEIDGINYFALGGGIQYRF